MGRFDKREHVITYGDGEMEPCFCEEGHDHTEQESDWHPSWGIDPEEDD